MTRACVVCYEAVTAATGAIRCSEEHETCNECFESIVTRASDDAAEVDIASLSAHERRHFGLVQCPCAGRSVHLCCKSGAFSDHAVAQHVSPSAFARYFDMRALVRVHEAETAAFADAQEALHAEIGKLRLEPEKAADAGTILLSRQLKKLMPHARQCPDCGWGPMDFRACADLQAHHGQVVKVMHRAVGPDTETFEVSIDNSCPRCGFFSAKRKAWPKWNGEIHQDELASPFEAADQAAKKFLPRVKLAERRRSEAEAAAKDAKASLDDKASELVAEVARRRQAELDYLGVRASIAASERSCAIVGARALAQLERERELRRRAEQRRRELEVLLESTHRDGSGGGSEAAGTVRTVLGAARDEAVGVHGSAEQAIASSGLPRESCVRVRLPPVVEGHFI